MNRRHVAAVFAAAVAVSLVGAPATMADWGEQASFSVERIDQSDVRAETPVFRYANLPPNARDAVRRAVESPDGSHTVYGREEWPDRFFYSDYTAPGRGTYAVVYEDRYYRLQTAAGGGFPFVYWLFELPFVLYGLGLCAVAARTVRGDCSPEFAVLAGSTGVAFHLLGPELGFPLLGPMQFVGLGAVSAVGLPFGVIGESARADRLASAD